MRTAVCFTLLWAGVATTAMAEDAVEFDTRRLFSCADVKPPQQADSARKVIVVVIPISANFNAEERTIESLRYELRMPKSVTVLDHLPKSQTGTSSPLRIWPLSAAGHHTAGRNRTTSDLLESLPSAR
jgi:hypothetical protein